MMSKIGNTILDAGEVTRGSELQPLLLEEPLINPTGVSLRSKGLNKPLQPWGQVSAHHKELQCWLRSETTGGIHGCHVGL